MGQQAWEIAMGMRGRTGSVAEKEDNEEVELKCFECDCKLVTEEEQEIGFCGKCGGFE